MKPKAVIEDNSALHKKIEQRAYELYELGSGEHGHDVEHWLHAEREVLAETSASSVRPKAQQKKTHRVPHNGR